MMQLKLSNVIKMPRNVIESKFKTKMEGSIPLVYKAIIRKRSGGKVAAAAAAAAAYIRLAGDSCLFYSSDPTPTVR